MAGQQSHFFVVRLHIQRQNRLGVENTHTRVDSPVFEDWRNCWSMRQMLTISRAIHAMLINQYVVRQEEFGIHIMLPELGVWENCKGLPCYPVLFKLFLGGFRICVF